jgi:amidase
LRRRETSSEEIVAACLERIDRLNPTLAAFITVDADGALRAAAAPIAPARVGAG